MADATAIDDLEAVRRIADVLDKFQHDERIRIIRWALERVGTPTSTATAIPGLAIPGQAIPGVGRQPSNDIRSFIQLKVPSNDVQFATVVAYYYAFEAPDIARKPEIGSADLREAARLSQRSRLTKPIVTLHNAVQLGYLDTGTTRGTFRINTVGENLVAMSLPTSEVPSTPRRRPRKSSPRSRKAK